MKRSNIRFNHKAGCNYSKTDPMMAWMKTGPLKQNKFSKKGGRKAYMKWQQDEPGINFMKSA